MSNVSGNAEEYLLDVRHLKKYFPVNRGIFTRDKVFVKAVDDVSFRIKPGETFGLVGESGCGKSTVGRSVLRLIEPTEGEIFFENEDIRKLDEKTLKERRRNFQIVFQDPFSSLNPRKTLRQIVSEPFMIQKICSQKEANERAADILAKVGFSRDSLDRYPHEFSGGQRQRICIARALALNPKLVICDESVSALDVSIQAQIINLLKKLQKEMGLAYLFISHDLRVIKHISDFVAIMYLGTLVEAAPTDELFRNPVHPYTRSLLSAIPITDPDIQHERIHISGDVPSPMNIPSGCRFHTRCFMAEERCKTEVPKYIEISPNHFCACNVCAGCGK